MMLNLSGPDHADCHHRSIEPELNLRSMSANNVRTLNRLTIISKSLMNVPIAAPGPSTMAFPLRLRFQWPPGLAAANGCN